MGDAADLASSHLAELVASELIDAAPDGMAVLDENGTLLVVNRRLHTLFGYGAGELVGTTVDALVPDNLRSVHEGLFPEHPGDPGSPVTGRAGLVLAGHRKDGSQLPIEVRLSPVRVGHRTLMLAAVREVTERIALEVAAREVREVLDAVQDALVVFDRRTLRITDVNDGAVRQLGYSRDDLLKLTPLQVMPMLTETEYRRVIDNLAPGESSCFTTVHRRKDGTDVEVDVTLQRPSLGSGIGGAHWLVSVARDVSQQVARDPDLPASDQELAVLEDRYPVAHDLHDRVVQRLFAAGLAASSISRRITDPVVADRLGQVVTELDAAIGDLRSSIFQLEPTVADDPLPRRVLDVCATECQHLGISSNVWFSGPVETVDPLRAEALLAVLREALSNVAHHAHASSVDVGVVVNGGISLRVEDDGVGVPADDGYTSHPRQGLESIAARARDLGGSFEVAPSAHVGTRLEWRIPGS